AAGSREGRGLVFTRGYLTFQTELYANSLDVEQHKTLASWLSRDRKVGVIEASSNAQLLTYITKGKLRTANKEKLCPVTYRSFPAMESAMDHGEIDAVLIDDTFIDEDFTTHHHDWRRIDDFVTEAASGFQEYRQKFLMSQGPKERVAI